MDPVHKEKNLPEIIDFHTHAFPEKIAAKTLSSLKAGIAGISGLDIRPASDGTVAGLCAVEEAAGISLSVVMPIATRPGQEDTSNAYAASVPSISGGRAVSFGSVHPAGPDAVRAVYGIAERGLPGMKLHPEFQKTYIDSTECLAVLRAAADCGLTVTVHAGRDIGLPPPVHCSPDRILRVLDAVPGLRLIAAHLGGWRMWEEVFRLLCGAPLLFDTAFLSGFADRSAVTDIIKAHGADRILFGSDCPWEDPADSLAFFRSLGLPPADEDLILCKNAAKLLCIGTESCRFPAERK